MEDWRSIAALDYVMYLSILCLHMIHYNTALVFGHLIVLFGVPRTDPHIFAFNIDQSIKSVYKIGKKWMDFDVQGV